MILQYLWQSRSNPTECDVILVTNSFSQTFAHSCILGACSRHLLNIFLKHSERNKKKPYVLILQNVKSEDLEAVLEFCYRGSVSVFERNINSIYDTAELLGIQNLCRKLISINPMIEKMSEIHRNSSTSNVVSRIKASHCLSQQNVHSVQLQNMFQHFLDYEDLVDITLLRGKHSFTAHIVVLSAFSMYFKNLTRCLQHNVKDAFVLIKDLRTQHVRAFLDYIYKGMAEFAGTTEVFCQVMSDWIDFSLLSISESETCQILTNATSIMKQKTEFSESVEEQNTYFSESILHPNMEHQEEVIERDENTQQDDCSRSVQTSRNFENVIGLEVSSSITTGSFKEVGPFEEHGGVKIPTETPVEEDQNSLKNENEISVEDDTAEGSSMPDEDGATEEAHDEAGENKPHKRWRDRDSVLTCYTCSENFESRKQLREHLIIHPNGRVMKCSYCGKGFDRPSQMKLHVRIHTGSKPFSCKQCGRAFAAKSALRKHADIHAKDKGRMFECAVCNKSFSRKEYLEEHIRTHTGNKPFECLICHKTFVGRTGLNHHRKTHADADEKKDSMCEVCGKSFTRHALWTHVKSHEKTHCCHHCNKCFSTASALRVHVTGTHLGCRSYQCEICGKGFIQKNHLIRHMKVHNNSKDVRSAKPFLCGKCPRTFKTKSRLESHTRVEHIEPGERPYSCEICNKRFAGRSTVIYHRRAHTGERPHCCSTCGKKFMRPDALRQHITSHTGERRHQCSVCSRKFATRSTLNKHIQSHKETEEKETTFSCNVCHKGFQSETQLSLHSPVHNGCRPLRCHVCSKSFRYQDSLTKHLNIHNAAQEDTPDSALSCVYSFQVCEQTFEHVTELGSHTKETENHSYASGNLIHSPDRDMVPQSLEQYPIPPAALNDNICIRDLNKTALVVPHRRPYSITIDGNLCCNTDAHDTNILPEVGNIDSSTDMPPPPASLRSLSHSHPGLDLHSAISLTASHIHDQETHPHIEMVGNPPAPYTEPLSKSFLFIDNCSQISQEHNKQKMIQDSGRMYSKVET
ncbi:hypothetical protein B7P43_G09777 [Cryptotermes secundus]|uniref:Zinc finger protein 865 n=2 Tax=Cryptotermes secundus TaxID=105785 RepID=A0A2J7Q9Z0_9NEOP|nr:hypothetical protein B7P43_G09777 [Cryptotermes secundus]